MDQNTNSIFPTENTLIPPTPDSQLITTSKNQDDEGWEKVIVPRKKHGEVVLQMRDTMERFLNALIATDGNMTEAGLRTFDTTSRVTANRLAHIYFKKAEAVGRIYNENKGRSWSQIQDKLWQLVDKTGSAELLKIALKLGGYGDLLGKDQRQIQATINLIKARTKEDQKKFGFVLDDAEEGEIVEEEEEDEGL